MKNNTAVRCISAVWCIRNAFFITCALSLLFVLVMSGNAQAQQPAPESSQVPSTHEPQSKSSKPEMGLTVEDPLSHPPPMTAKQKFGATLESTFDPFDFSWVAMIAGVQQARNEPKAWGQGWGAFGKRYAASFADEADFNFMVDAVLPSLLKDDPRYYRMGQGGVFKRSGYALTRVLITRTDSGHKTFNLPEIAGAGISSGISNAYYPSEYRTLSQNLSRWGLWVGEDAALNLIKEFWPDVRHKILKK